MQKDVVIPMISNRVYLIHIVVQYMELKRKKKKLRTDIKRRQKCIDIKLFYRKVLELEYAAIVTQLLVQSVEHMCLMIG